MLYAAGSGQDISVDAAHLSGLTWQDGYLWYADSDSERIVAVDPYTASTVQVIECPGLRVGLAVVQGGLLYAAGPEYRLCLVEPSAGTIIAETPNPRPGMRIAGMESGRSGLWIGYENRLDLRSMPDLALVTCIGVPGHISGITVTDRFVAYSDPQAEEIVIVNPVLERAVLPVNVHGSPTGLAWDGRRIWYCDTPHARLRAIDVPGIVNAP